MSRPYAWRVLGIPPILKASACTNTVHRAGSGQVRRGSGAVNKPGLGLPAAVQNEQTVYDIIYDINVGTVLTPYQ